MTQVLIQIIILAVVLFVLRVIRGLIPKPHRPKLLPVDVSPFFLLIYMWFLSHTWPDPWFAAVIFIWMMISIGVTLWWGLSKGELLWNKFLLFYWRMTTILLYVGYVTTIISLFLRL